MAQEPRRDQPVRLPNPSAQPFVSALKTARLFAVVFFWITMVCILSYVVVFILTEWIGLYDAPLAPAAPVESKAPAEPKGLAAPTQEDAPALDLKLDALAQFGAKQHHIAWFERQDVANHHRRRAQPDQARNVHVVQVLQQILADFFR